MYQIRLLKGRNAAAAKRFAEIFGKKTSSNTILRFSRLDLSIGIAGFNARSAAVDFNSENPDAARKLAAALSQSFKGMSVLLGEVHPAKWYCSMQVTEYRDGKVRNVSEGRGMQNSTVSEAIEAYRLHRELSE